MIEHPKADQALIDKVLEEAATETPAPFAKRDFSTLASTKAWLRYRRQNSGKIIVTVRQSSRSFSLADSATQGLTKREFWHTNLDIGLGTHTCPEISQEMAWHQVLVLEQLRVSGKIEEFDVGRAVYFSYSPQGWNQRELVALFITAPEEQKRAIAVQIQRLESELKSS